jgi:hypothetical protein
LNDVRVNNHKIQDGDFAVLLESLSELFQETGEAVTPGRLAERMERKLHRRIPIHTASYIYTSLGFVTGKLDSKGSRYCIIPNPNLLEEKRTQYCKVDVNSSNHQSKH